MIRIRDLHKEINGKQILSRCTLHLEAGKIHALIGPNGSGKTTLLRMLNLLDRPSSGTIEFNGLKALGEGGALAREKITMVFQQPSLFKTTVCRNVAYGLRMRGISKKRIQERVDEALGFVDMTDYCHQKAWTLSAGEAQRVALARALAIRPKVLFLDEPTANLDPYNAKKVEEVIEAVRSKHQTTVVMATHNLFQARRLADKVVFLYNGRVIETDDTETFFESPQEELSRRFIEGDLYG